MTYLIGHYSFMMRFNAWQPSLLLTRFVFAEWVVVSTTTAAHWAPSARQYCVQVHTGLNAWFGSNMHSLLAALFNANMFALHTVCCVICSWTNITMVWSADKLLIEQWLWICMAETDSDDFGCWSSNTTVGLLKFKLAMGVRLSAPGITILTELTLHVSPCPGLGRHVSKQIITRVKYFLLHHIIFGYPFEKWLSVFPFLCCIYFNLLPSSRELKLLEVY
jgi:hypothetical protein